MNEIKMIDTEMRLSDLTALGRQGQATARLEDGSTIELHPRFGTKEAWAYINGEKQLVKIICPYHEIYSQIRTVKRGDVLVARREHFGERTLLKLTGKGYARPQKK